MILNRIWFFLILPIVLAGCATAPDVKDMVVAPEAMEERSYPEKLWNNVIVSDVVGGEETNPLWTSEINAEGFKGALIESLGGAGLLSKDASTANYHLIVGILDVENPLFALDTTVTAVVEYLLLNSETGEEVFHETLTAEYTATFSQAFFGFERLKIANEAVVRENISMLLERLSRLDLQ